MLDDPQDVVDPPAHELGEAMGFRADADRYARRVDMLDPADPLRVVMRVEHVGGDVFRRPGDEGLDAVIEWHRLLLL